MRWAARSKSAHEDPGVVASDSAHNKPANHDVVSRLHETAGADISEQGTAGCRQIVNFHDSCASDVIHTLRNGRVVRRQQGGDQSRFRWVAWSQSAALNLSYLIGSNDAADLRCLPIIIHSNGACALVEFQSRVGQRIGNSEICQGRAYCPDDHPLRSASLDNETGDQHVLPGTYMQPSRNVSKRCRYGGRCWRRSSS
jgi:hypothetical protein